MAGNFSDHVAWVDGADALSPSLFQGYAMRTYSAHLRLSMRFSTSAAITTLLACRPSAGKHRPSRLHNAVPGSTSTCQPYPRRSLPAHAAAPSDEPLMPLSLGRVGFRGCARRRDRGRLGTTRRDVGVDVLTVVGAAAGEERRGTTNQVEQETDLRAIVGISVGEHWRTPRLRPQLIERPGPAAEDVVVRHRQVEAEQLQTGGDQPLRPALRQMEHGPQRQDHGDGERGMGRPPLPVRNSAIQAASTSGVNHRSKVPQGA